MTARNHWKPWTPAEERRLAHLAESGVGPLAIARELDRSENSIRNKAKQLGIALPVYKPRSRAATHRSAHIQRRAG